MRMTWFLFYIVGAVEIVSEESNALCDNHLIDMYGGLISSIYTSYYVSLSIVFLFFSLFYSFFTIFWYVLCFQLTRSAKS